MFSFAGSCVDVSSKVTGLAAVTALLFACTRQKGSEVEGGTTHPAERSGRGGEGARVEEPKLFRAQYGYVLLDRASPQLEMTGAPQLLSRRDDHDESFVARRDVVMSTEARRLQTLGALTLHGPSGHCPIKITELKALAWAMPSDLRRASTWDEMSDEPLAKAVFASGALYLAGVVGAGAAGCEDATWAASEGARIRIRSAQAGLTTDVPTIVTGEPPVAYLSEWDSAYQELLTSTRSESVKKNALPSTWRGLPNQVSVWSFSAAPESRFYVTTFTRSVSTEQVGRYNEPGKPWFKRTGLAVWDVVPGRAPELAGPQEGVLLPNETCSNVGAVTVGDGDPLLTFSTEQRQVVLRRIGSKYVVDIKLTIGPGR